MKPCYKKVLAIVVGVVTIIFIPFLINWLVPLCAPNWLSPIAGSSETEGAWMNFWSNYIGSIFATCVAFFVLYKTLKQNEKENIQNRNDTHAENVANSREQLRQLRYEVAKQHLSDTRDTLVDCFMALEQERTNDLLWELQQEEPFLINLLAQRESISKVVDDENRAFYKLELLFPKSTRSDGVDRIMTDIRRYSIESHLCLSDLVWLAQFYTSSDINLSDLSVVSDAVFAHSVKPQQHSRLTKEGYSTIDKIILEKKWFDFQLYKEQILNAWQSERNKVNQLLLNSLNELNEFQTQIVESIIK